MSRNPFQSPEVRVVEASAGSGKTYALAKRYVQLLLLGVATPRLAPMSSPKHILAITFTNKAAGEMKGRIIDLLKRIALEQLPDPQAKSILEPLGLSSSQAAGYANALMEELIRHYHFFQVQTIDSFMNTLLVGCAFKINLSARFKIKRNVSDYLQLSVDQLLDEAHTRPDIKALFETFIRQYLFLENRSGWFPKQDLLAVIGTLFNQYNTYQMPFLTFDEGKLGVGGLKKEFLRMAKEFKGLLPAGADQRFVRSLDGFIRDNLTGFDLDEVSRYFAREAIPVKAGIKVPTRLDEKWQVLKELLRAICLHEAYGVFNPYVHLFEATMGHLNRLQTKEDILFLPQLNKKTAELFDDGLITVEELYCRLAARFRHYLVDEFQDTSVAQWRNLRLMVEEGLSTGGTLFYVGDKKQAIYAFRGGQSALFDDLQGDLSNFNVGRETLSMNYRSHKAIVDFNNRVFHLDNLRAFLHALEKEDSFQNKDIAFNDHDQERLLSVFGTAQQMPQQDQGAGAVRVEMITGRKKEDRLVLVRQRVLEIVKEAKSRFNYSDMAILTRDNAEVQMVTHWLVQEGIYAQSDRTSDIKQHALILELFAFLRFLRSPLDNAAFAEFLLGDLFPKATGVCQSEIQNFLFACRVSKTAKVELCLYKCFQQSYPQLWQSYFTDFIAQAGTYPLYELAISICGRWRCVPLFPEAQGFVMHFLELIKRQEENSCDLETFLDYFTALEDEERFVPTLAQEAIRVLTIHKAKGLEFPLVIVPFLEMSIKAGSSDRNGSQSFVWDVEEEGMRLLRLKTAYTRFSPELRIRYVEAYKESFFAELNSIYVALTRPILEMFVLIPERVGNSVNPVPHLIPPDLFSVGSFYASQVDSRAVVKRQFLPPVEYRQWIDHLQEEYLFESRVQARQRLEGEIMHCCLSKIGDLIGADGAATIDQAVVFAVAQFPHVGDWSVYRSRLEALLSLKDWHPFFYVEPPGQVLCEQEIVNRFGDTKRLDRLIIFPQEVWVVDFKTSRLDAPAQKAQMDEYKTLVAALYPGRKVKGVLLYLQ